MRFAPVTTLIDNLPNTRASNPEEFDPREPYPQGEFLNRGDATDMATDPILLVIISDKWRDNDYFELALGGTKSLSLVGKCEPYPCTPLSLAEKEVHQRPCVNSQ